MINRLTGNAEIRFEPEKRGEGDPQRRQPDISRARRELDWEPEVDLETGILKTVPYFKQELGLA